MKDFLIKYRHWIFIPLLILIWFSSQITSWIHPNEASAKYWEIGDYTNLVSECLKDSKELEMYFPEQTKVYCECFTKQIQNEFSKQEFESILLKSEQEQRRIILPFISDCEIEFQESIKSKND